MARIYAVKTIKHGTPTGTVTMPTPLTALPETVRGSISMDEGDPTYQDFFTDQTMPPIDSVQVSEGETTFTTQFHNVLFADLEALKGGESVAAVAGTSAAKWKKGVTFRNDKLAIQIETESGHFFNFYNARIFAKITGGGGRDSGFTLQVNIKPLVTADGAGDWEISDVAIPQA
ncbi:MAG: hypothetical protein AB2L20_14870 [Mangrovibacterium sp.]